MKGGQTHIIDINNVIAFHQGVIYPNWTSGSEIRAIQMFENWEIKMMTSARNLSHTLQTPHINFELLKKNLRRREVGNF